MGHFGTCFVKNDDSDQKSKVLTFYELYFTSRLTPCQSKIGQICSYHGQGLYIYMTSNNFYQIDFSWAIALNYRSRSVPVRLIRVCVQSRVRFCSYPWNSSRTNS